MLNIKRPFQAAAIVFMFLFVLALVVVPAFAGQSTAQPLTIAQQSCDPAANNAISNFSFESGTSNWTFYTNGAGTFQTAGNAYHCASAAKVTINQAGSNVQLYQAGIELEPNSDYQLRFAAKSSSGRDARFFLQKHQPNYANYGLNYVADLSTEWQTFEVNFTTSGFSSPVDNGRLRIWLAPYDKSGEVYYFDQIELNLLDGTPPEPTEPPPTEPPPTEPAPTEPAPTATPDEPNPTPAPCDSVAGNVLANPSFESGTSSWSFYTNGSGSFTSDSGAYHCDSAAKINISGAGSNVQLYQAGVSLQPNTNYRLSFAAKSNSGHNLSVSVQNHEPNYAYWGLKNHVANLSANWQTFEVEFTTEGFSSPQDNGRLRFWLAPYDAAGDVYWIDNVELVALDSAPNPTNTPPPNPDPTNTPPPPPSGNNQLEFFDWNGIVTEEDRGFPRNQPPKENYDWTSPINYADGTLHVRAEIFSQAVPQQDMRLQFCFWQEKNGNNFGLETCITTKNVPGNPGTVVCWSEDIDKLWKLNNTPLDWDRPRYRVAVPIKTGSGLPVSDYNGWNWNGENPNHWYPLDMRFTAIVVAKGSSFSGWDAYGGC